MAKATEKEIILKVVFDDTGAVKGFGELDKGMSKAEKNSQNMTGSVLKANIAFAVLEKGVQLAGQAIGFFIDIGKKAVDTFVELSQQGGKVQDVNVGFQKAFKDSTKALNDLRKASNGTISDYDLMLSASKASMLGVTQNSEELARLLEVARARGQALGIDTTQAFEDIVTGIGRNSPLILDNLGITTGKYQEQVAMLEARGIELDENAKKDLLLKTVLEDQSKAVETTTTKWDQLRVVKENLRNEIANKIAPAFDAIATKVMPILDTAIENTTKFFTDWYNNNETFILEQLGRLEKAFGQLGVSIQQLFQPTDEEKEKMEALANEGLKTAVDFLVGTDGKPGLIKNIENLMLKLGDKKNLDTIIETFKQLNKTLQSVNSAIAWLISAWDDLKLIAQVANAVINPVGSLINSYKNQSDAKPSNVIVGSGFGNDPIGIAGKAIGGPASGWTKVGEQGEELVHLPNGSRVYNNDDTKRMMGSTVNVEINIANVDNEKRVLEIAEAIQRIQSENNLLGNLNLI